MNVPAPQIAASAECVVRDFHCFHFAVFFEHLGHLLERDEAFRIVGNYHKFRLQRGDDFFHRFQCGARLVEVGAVPVLRDSAHFAHIDIEPVFQNQIQHEVVRAVWMLIVRRVEVGDVKPFQFHCERDGILLVNFNLALKIAEHRLFQLDSSENARERVPPRRPEAADARVLVLVEALENAAGVHMD